MLRLCQGAHTTTLPINLSLKIIFPTINQINITHTLRLVLGAIDSFTVNTAE